MIEICTPSFTLAEALVCGIVVPAASVIAHSVVYAAQNPDTPGFEEFMDGLNEFMEANERFPETQQSIGDYLSAGYNFSTIKKMLPYCAMAVSIAILAGQYESLCQSFEWKVLLSAVLSFSAWNLSCLVMQRNGLSRKQKQK